MISLEVKNIMIQDVVTFSADALVLDIAKVMAKKNISCVIIVKNKTPIGVLTERDVLKKVVSENKVKQKLMAKDIMTENPLTIPESESIFNAASIMEKRKIRRLPVVKDGKLVGLITETDVIRAMTGVAKYMNNKLIEYITNA